MSGGATDIVHRHSAFNLGISLTLVITFFEAMLNIVYQNLKCILGERYHEFVYRHFATYELLQVHLTHFFYARRPKERVEGQSDFGQCP